jgi:hypothetical protein
MGMQIFNHDLFKKKSVFLFLQKTQFLSSFYLKTPKKYHKNIHKSLTNFKTIPQNHSRNKNQPNLN